MKYDKMVAVTKEKSMHKVEIANKAIFDMLADNEYITVADLARKTGLSRGFFYKNSAVKVKLEAALKEQELSEVTRVKPIKHIQEQKNYRVNESETYLKKELAKVNIQNDKLLKRNLELVSIVARLQQIIDQLEGI